MKLIRFGQAGQERPGILDTSGNIRDVSKYVVDFNPRYLADGRLLEQLRALKLERLPIVDKTVRIGPCIDAPGKILCVGFNALAHAQEMGALPFEKKDLLVFLKPSSALCGPNDPIFYARHFKKLDWEAELAVVIGKQAKYVSPQEAKDYILGYACFNDLSERYLQFETEDKQFTKGKGFDHAAPLGPYLVTQDEIKDANNVQIQLWVNDSLRQDFNTGDYIHNDCTVVSYLSQYFTLYPGDVISMGSAPGSAASWNQQFLKPGDIVKINMEELGNQEQQVIFEAE